MRFQSPLLLVALACSLQNASAQNDRGPSTAEERARALSTIDDLEANPLGPAAKEERAWLIKFLIQVPDLHVGICADLLGDLPKGSKKDTDLLVLQPTFSSARYAIQHGGGNASSLDQYQAGMLGTLTTYENMVKVKPADKQPAMDELLKKRDDGSLAAYVDTQVKRHCKT